MACGFGPPERRAPIRQSELKSLDALGIVSLDVHAQPLDAIAPQGARLTGYVDDPANDNECALGAREAA